MTLESQFVFPAGQRDVTAEGPPFHIARDGTWYHGASAIMRPALVELFASILRCLPDGSYWLWHPGERCRVTVEDAPLIVENITRIGQDLHVTIRFHPPVVLGQNADVVCHNGVPYIALLHGLRARCPTAVYYDLVQMAVAKDGQMVVSSGGKSYSLGALAGE